MLQVWNGHLLLEGVLWGRAGVLGRRQSQAADGHVWGCAGLAPLGDAKGQHLQQLSHPAPKCKLTMSQHTMLT